MRFPLFVGRIDVKIRETAVLYANAHPTKKAPPFGGALVELINPTENRRMEEISLPSFLRQLQHRARPWQPYGSS